MDWILGVVGVLVVGAIGWSFGPVRNRLTLWRTRVTKDHGIQLRAYTNIEDMRDLDLRKLLRAEPEWLAGMNFYFDRPSPPEPPSSEPWWEWGRRHGGSDVYASHVLVVIQATLDRTIVIRPPRVVDKKTQIQSGIVCGPEGHGGNGILVRRFYVALDDDQPTARYLDADNNEQTNASFQMAKGDSTAILAIGVAQTGRHEWHLELPVIVDGSEFNLRIDDDGRSLVTVGPDGVPGYWWVSDEGRWMYTP